MAQHRAEAVEFALRADRDDGAGIRQTWQIAFSDPPPPDGAPANFSQLSKQTDAPHILVLEATLRRLELATELDVERLQASGFNTLGNVFPTFVPHESGDSLVSDDGSVVYRPAVIAIATPPEVDVQIRSGDRIVGRAAAQKQAGRIEIPLEYIPHGEHEIRVDLTRSLSAKETVKETMRLQVLSDSPELASLPVARRFVKGVDVADGHLTYSSTDIKVPLRAMSLEFIRTYSNLAAQSAAWDSPVPLGFGWTHNYNSWLQPWPGGASPTAYLIAGAEGNGRIYHLAKDEPGTAKGSAGHFGRLVQKGATNFELTTPAGLVYRYSRPITGSNRIYLEAVRDLNGNELKFTYTQDGLLDTVSGAGGGPSFKFTYERRNVGSTTVPLLVKLAVVNVPTHTVTYEYDNGGNLIASTRGNAAKHYEYTSNDVVSPHRLRTFQDPDGTRTTYAYLTMVGGSTDPWQIANLERVQSIREDDGPATEFTYQPKNPQGPFVADICLVKRSDQAKPTTYKFRADTTVETITDPDGKVTRFLYRTDRLLAEETDVTGRVTIYRYDETGTGNLLGEIVNLTHVSADYEPVTDAKGQRIDELRTDYAYGSSSRILSVTQKDYIGGQEVVRRQTTYTYTPTGNLESKNEPDGRTTTYRYDANGNLLKSDKTDGDSISYGDYTPTGLPQEIRKVLDAQGGEQVTRQTFDPIGRLIGIVDSIKGVVVRQVGFAYDDLDNTKQKITRPPKIEVAEQPVRVVEFDYSPGGRLLCEVTKEGEGQTQRTLLVRKWSYYKSGRTKSIEEWPDGVGQEKLFRSFEYDSTGNATVEKNRRGVVLTHSYDLHGRRVATTRKWPEGGEPTASPDATYTYWDMSSNVRNTTDHQGNVTETKYDKLGRLVSRALALPERARERFWYDGQGNLYAKEEMGTDAAPGAKTLYSNNQFQQKLSETGEADASGNRITTTYKYDRDGKLLLQSDDTWGLSTVVQYDRVGRSISKTETLAGGPTYVTSLVYDDAAYRVRITSPGSSGISFDEYRDERGLVVKRVVDPDNSAGSNVTTYIYDALGNLVATSVLQQDGSFATTRFVVDGLGRRRKALYPLGIVEEWTYDGEGNVLSHTDKAGAVRFWEYDSRGRVKTESARGKTEPSPTVLKTIRYDDSNRQVIETFLNDDQTADTVTTTLDALGRPVSILDGQFPNAPLRRRYDRLDLVAFVDRRGNVTTFVYDKLHRLISTTNALQQAVTTAYDDKQRRKVTTDAMGNDTIIVYDAKRRETSMTRDGVRQWLRTYDGDDRLVSETDAVGRTTTSTYDKAGRVLTKQLPGGRTTRFEYDRAGKLIREWFATAPGRTPDRIFGYDALGRLVSQKDAVGLESIYEYDGEGRKVREKDAEGLVTQYDYDRLGNINAVTRAPGDENAVYSMPRDRRGRIQEVRDPTGRVLRFSHFPSGRVRSRSLVPVAISGDNSVPITITYTYDLDGNPLTLTRADGSVLTYDHDAANRLKSIIVSGSQMDPRIDRIDSEYNDNGHLTATSVSKHWMEKVYVENQTRLVDPMGRPRVEVIEIGPSQSGGSLPTQSVSREYFPDGRLSKLTDPDGAVTAFEYHPQGLLKSSTGAFGKVAYEYDAADLLRAVTLPSNYRTEYDRWTNGWIAKIRHLKPGGGALLELTYDLNKVGDVKTVVMKSAEDEQRIAYIHDALHRLAGESVFGGTAIAYTYDAAGRRQTSGENVWILDGHGRPKEARDANGRPWVKCTYGPSGLLWERLVGSNYMHFWYTPLQQLAITEWGAYVNNAFTALGQMRVDYDANGQRFKRSLWSKERGSSAEAYWNDGEERKGILPFPLPADGGKLTQRIYRAPGFLAAAVTQPSGPQALWLILRDKIGSAVGAVNTGSGEFILRPFSGFGTALSLSFPPQLTFAFAGGEQDAMEDGYGTHPIQRLGARLYDTLQGRFIAPDPLESTDAVALADDPYLYARNRPTSFVDPTGLSAEPADDDYDVFGAIGGAIQSGIDAASSFVSGVAHGVSDAARELESAWEGTSARTGRATSATDDDSYVPLRPQRTGQSLQERTRRTTSTPYADFGVTVEKLRFEASSSRGADINRVTTTGDDDPGQGIRSAMSSIYTFVDEYLWSPRGQWVKGYTATQRGNVMEILAGNPLDKYKEGLRGVWNTLKTGSAKWREAAVYADYFEEAASGGRDVIGSIKTTLERFSEETTKAYDALTTYIVNPATKRLKSWQPQSLANDTIREITLIVPTGKGKEALEGFQDGIAKAYKESTLSHSIPDDVRPNIQEGIPGRAGKLLKGVGYAGAGYSLYNLHGELQRGEYYEASVDVANVLSVAVAATPVGRISSAYGLGTAAGSVINFGLEHTPVVRTANEWFWDRIYDVSRFFVRKT